GGNSKADARATNDHRVDADHLARQVDERTARVARVDAGVGLQVILDLIGMHATTTLAAQHTCRQRVVETERRADRQNPVAYAQFARVGKRRGWQIFGFDLHDSQIYCRVRSNDLRFEVATV